MNNNFKKVMPIILSALMLASCGGKSSGNNTNTGTNTGTDTGSTDTTPAHEHAYGEFVVTTAATCEDAGVETATCECGETTTREIPALGHNWDNGTITTQPTCDADGVKTFSCQREGCTSTKQEDVARLGHTKESDWTKNEEGHWHACEHECGTKFDYAAHTPVAKSDADNHWEECSVCGYITTAKAAHVFDQEVKNSKYFVEAATWSHGDVYYKSCVCGASSNSAGSTFLDTDTEYVVQEAVITVQPTTTAAGALKIKYTNGKFSPEFKLPELGNTKFWTKTEDKSVANKVTATYKFAFNLVQYSQWSNSNGQTVNTGDNSFPNWTKVFVTDLAKAYTSGFSIAKEHVASSTWSTADGKHFHACNCGDCSYKWDEAEHTVVQVKSAKYLKSESSATAFAEYYKSCPTCLVALEETFVDTVGGLCTPVSHSNLVLPTAREVGSVDLTYSNGETLTIKIPSYETKITVSDYGDNEYAYSITNNATCTSSGIKSYTLKDLTTITDVMEFMYAGASWAQCDQNNMNIKFSGGSDASYGFWKNVSHYLVINNVVTINLDAEALGHYYEYAGNGTNIYFECQNDTDPKHNWSQTYEITGYGKVIGQYNVSGMGLFLRVDLKGTIPSLGKAVYGVHPTNGPIILGAVLKNMEYCSSDENPSADAVTRDSAANEVICVSLRNVEEIDGPFLGATLCFCK